MENNIKEDENKETVRIHDFFEKNLTNEEKLESLRRLIEKVDESLDFKEMEEDERDRKSTR